jgi:3-deoxy-7-phosphoheptulonate synthase
MPVRDQISLAGHRAELDSIDDAILDLIERRLAVATAIAGAKTDGDRLKLRLERQRAVIARLQRRARDPEVVAPVWRELMAHSLQRQQPTTLLLCAPANCRERLLRLVRDRFGSAAPVRWTDCPDEAVREAQHDALVAILGGTDHPPLPPGLVAFDRIGDEAVAIGRVVEDEWSPASWRRRETKQLPDYPDRDALARAEAEIGAAPPLVAVAEIVALKQSLARVAAGDAFLIQGGDCAESFAEFSEDKVIGTADLIARMAARIDVDTVQVARIAGQFVKPRSTPSETIGGATLPVYRGDAVNGAGFTAAERAPDPKRMLRALAQSRETLKLLAGRPLYTSHEALLLHYEEPLVRFDPATERDWTTSAHMIWIGDRTRAPDGGHVEFARGVANPIGIKCGPSLGADELLRLIDRLDPEGEPGRLTLIARLGRDQIGRRLPLLMRASARAGRQPVWAVDPMHGNTRIEGSRKIRFLGDMIAETRAFFEIARSEGIWAGGVHLELTGSDVTECVARLPFDPSDVAAAWRTHCDPRLNPTQAMELADVIADLARAALPRADAA